MGGVDLRFYKEGKEGRKEGRRVRVGVAFHVLWS